MPPEPPAKQPFSADESEPVVESPDLATHALGQPAGSSRVPWRGVVNAGLMSLVVCIAGLTPVAAKDAMAELPALSTGFVRFGLAAGLLWLTRRFIGRRDAEAAVRPVDRSDWPRLWLAAALCVPINQFCFLLGVKLANASHAGLFYALNPVIVYLLTLALGTARLGLRMSLATVLAFGGAAVIGWERLQIEGDWAFFVGDVLLLGAVASWAAYSVVAVPLAEKLGPLRAVSLVMGLGTLLYAPALLVDGLAWLEITLTWRALAGFAFITVVTSYLNYLLWFVLLTRIDINRLSVAVNAAPIVAVTAAWAWHDEPISQGLLLGAGGILVAIWMANWDKLRQMRTRRQA